MSDAICACWCLNGVSGSELGGETRGAQGRMVVMRDNAHVDAAHFDEVVDGGFKVVEGLRLVNVAHVLANVAPAVLIGRDGSVISAPSARIFLSYVTGTAKETARTRADIPDKCRLVEHSQY